LGRQNSHLLFVWNGFYPKRQCSETLQVEFLYHSTQLIFIMLEWINLLVIQHIKE
jgi:hypothetical protein